MKRTPLRRTGPLTRRTPLERALIRAAVRKRNPFEPKSGPSDKTLNDLCREVVFARDGYKCVTCGKPCTETWVSGGVRRYAVIQWSHVYTRSIKYLCWDLRNSMTQCGGCHIWWGDNFNSEAHAWHREKYPGVLDALDLIRLANKGKRIVLDRALILLELRQALQRYGGSQG